MKKQEKLWTPGFLILWQGQLVSTAGDAVYSIALGFWVLAATGSTALMGTLMAASTLPGVLAAPFAGVLIDRANKKRLFIAMDFLRGVCISLISFAAYGGRLAVWMVFAAGILLSVCGAVFSPGIESAIPDLVPESKIPNANAAFSIVTSGSNLAGSVAGGFLYQFLGAPALFLFDGVSFLFSGLSLPFVKIPDGGRKQDTHFFGDMKDGFRYMLTRPGLRMILAVAALCNFFSFIGIVLILPMCKEDPSLGAGCYGVLMGGFMGGAMLGYLGMSVITLRQEWKVPLFMGSSLVCYVLFIVGINQRVFPLMVVLILVSGLANALLNTILISAIQVSAPQEVRGKVMAFLHMVTSGLTPFAMALGGVLGEIFPIRLVISMAFFAGLCVIVPSFFIKPAREFVLSAGAASGDSL